MSHEAFLSNHYKLLGNQKTDFRNENLLDLLVEDVSGPRVLDIGSGGGALLNRLTQEGHVVHGIEPNSELARLSHHLYPRLNIYNQSAEKIPKEITPLDTITSIDVLEHIEDDRACLRSIFSSLRPGGTFLVVVPAHAFLYGKRDEKQGHFRRYSQHELVAKLREAGFSIRKKRFWNALGVLPYFVSEKLLKRELKAEFRNSQKNSPISFLLNRILFSWFKFVENKISFGFGLSVMVLAEKK